LHLAKPTPAS